VDFFGGCGGEGGGWEAHQCHDSSQARATGVMVFFDTSEFTHKEALGWLAITAIYVP
jgi:hypothetical protein